MSKASELKAAQELVAKTRAVRAARKAAKLKTAQESNALRLARKAEEQKIELGAAHDVLNPKETLILDIETSPIEGHVWGTFKQNLSLEQIRKDWSILSYAAKWLGKDQVYYQDTGGRGADKTRDDSILLGGLWDLMNKAKRVIAQNGNKFDIKKINWRLAAAGFPAYSGVRVYDTLLASRRMFAATSHKLGWLSEQLTDSPKSKHRKFPGWELWNECLLDNPKAWAEMEKYNIQDIKATEKLWRVQQQWVRNRSMLGTYDKQGV